MEEQGGILEALGILSMLGAGGGSVTDSLNIGYNPTTGMPYDPMDPVGMSGEMGGTGARPSAKTPSLGQQIRNIKAGDAVKSINKGLDNLATNQINAIRGAIPAPVQGPLAVGEKLGIGQKATRFAGQALKSPIAKGILKAAPVVGGALAVGDLVLGKESLGNKAMDAGFMAGGAALGSFVPVVGTALGATGGKMLSDGIQFLVGGGKSDRERQLEELLASRGVA